MISNKKEKIGFIGLGKLGLPCAEVIAENGYEVSGYDINNIQSDKIVIKSDIKSCIKSSDLIFIAVPTPHDEKYDGREPSMHLPPKDFDYKIVIDVLKEAAKYLNNNKTLILISTVLPGTIREKFISFVKDINFIYNPYLIAMGSVKWDMVNPEMIMIGTDSGKIDANSETLIKLYKNIMKNSPRTVIGTWEECESIKIFYNTFISAKISLVNMIQDVAEKQGNINVDVVTKALAESTMRIMGPQYMKAGMGDGGGCHPRDNIALRYLSKKLELGYDLFFSIMNSREHQAKNIALKLSKLEDQHSYPIYIHGKAYKPNVSYCCGSYSILIGNYLKKLNKNFKYIDPLTGDKNYPKEPSIILLAHSATTTYKYTSLKKNTDDYYCNFPDKSIILDPWRTYNNDRHHVIHYGNTRFFK